MGGWDDSNDDGFGNSGFGTGGFGSGGFGGGGGSTTVKSSFTTTGKSGGGGFGSKSVSFKGGATSSTSTPRPNSSGGGGGSSWKPKIKDWEPVGNLNKMISVHNIPFFGQTQAFMGRTLWDWFKRSKAHFSDIIDRLNCHIVPMFLMFFVMLISANIFGAFGMEPMRCLRSPELNEEEREYALDYCQSKNTYYVAPEEGIPWSNKERRERQLGYYHWVPIMMFLQSMLFMLPNWLWNALNQMSGVEFIKFIEEATRLKNLELSNPERPTLVHELSERLTEAILNREAYFRRRVVGCRMGRSMGSFVSFLYVVIKLLYLLNVTLQFLILNSFIGSGYTLWGWDVMKALVRGENWQDSPIFPRLTLCDVPIRRLGDVPRYTLQCHLRINTYNEKIYLFIWWGFLLVAGLTFFNFIYYLLTLVLFPWTQENSVRHLLKQERHETIVYSEKKHDKKLIKRFAYEALCKDGVLLFWFIESHAGPIVARDLLGEIFDFYKGKMHEEEDDDTSEKMGLMKKNRGGSFSSSHSTGSTLGDEDDEEAWGHGGGGGVTHRFGTGITPSAPKFSTAEAGSFPPSQERELIDGEEDTTARVDGSHIYSSTPKGPLINGGGGLRRSQNRHGGHDRHSNNRRGSYEEHQGYRPGLLSRAFRFVFGGGGGGGGGYYNHNNQQQQPLTMSTPYFSASYYGGKRPSDAAVIKNV